MKKVFYSLLTMVMSTLSLQAQVETSVRSISLDEAIHLARVQSVDAAVALNELKTAYWEYRTYKAELLPEVNFKATLPSYNKSYTEYRPEYLAYRWYAFSEHLIRLSEAIHRQ